MGTEKFINNINMRKCKMLVFDNKTSVVLPGSEFDG